MRKNVEVARASKPLKARPESPTLLDRSAVGSYRRRPSGGNQFSSRTFFYRHPDGRSEEGQDGREGRRGEP